MFEHPSPGMFPRSRMFSRLVTSATALFLILAFVFVTALYLTGVFVGKSAPRSLTQEQRATILGSREWFGKVETVTYTEGYKEMSLDIVFIVPDLSRLAGVVPGNDGVADIPSVEKRYAVKILEDTTIVNGERSSILPGMFLRVVAPSAEALNGLDEFGALEIEVIADND